MNRNNYELAAPIGPREDDEVDFGVEYFSNGEKWAAKISVTSNGRKDLYTVTGFASKEEATKKVMEVVQAVAAGLGIPNA